MRLFGFLLMILFIFSCNHAAYQVNYAEKNLFSTDEKAVIDTYFNIDTTNTKIESIKIQTH